MVLGISFWGVHMFASSPRASNRAPDSVIVAVARTSRRAGRFVPTLLLLPGTCLACACGCGVFDVGTASMFPQHTGTALFVEYDFMNQNRNWSGTASAPAADNADKDIRTDAVTMGIQYQLNRSWGASVALPYIQRFVREADEDSGDIESHTHAALGDIRVTGAYTGLSADMSTGLTFGVKLPTGDSTYRYFEPDTQIGTGSTDALIGAYQLGNLTRDGQWRYFVQAVWDQVIWHKASYRPGSEGTIAAGAYFEGWRVTSAVKVTPMLQFSATYRGHDGGPEGDPANTGYTRLLVMPGLELDAKGLTVSVDAGLPIYASVSGDQLVSSLFLRVNANHRF
jgi:hypothetical protein